MGIGYKAPLDDVGLWGEGTTWNGVVGLSHSTTGGFGVWGKNDKGGTGVVGESDGWHAVGGFTKSTVGGAGVYGEHTSADFAGAGVLGHSRSQDPTNGWGVIGTGPTGVRGEGNWGVHGIGTVAGLFQGDVTIHGGLNVYGYIYGSGYKSFKIDHPVDPQNKYLLHSAVESSEMKNVYDGAVEQLDADGSAWVELPEWFEALNGDFRYQLTAVGGAAPNLHVAEEIYENRFRIAGGEEGMKVCWQVTGTRKDRWAQANPFEVEQEKPQEERGRYVHPDLYGMPEEQRVGPQPPQRPPGIEPPQAPQIPPGADLPPEERLQQTYELRRQAEVQEHQQQIDELRQEIKKLRRKRRKQ